MYVRDPLRVVVTGPLAAYAAGFCAELERQGYAPQPGVGAGAADGACEPLARRPGPDAEGADRGGRCPAGSWRNGAGSTASSGPGAGSGPC